MYSEETLGGTRAPILVCIFVQLATLYLVFIHLFNGYRMQFILSI